MDQVSYQKVGIYYSIGFNSEASMKDFRNRDGRDPAKGDITAIFTVKGHILRIQGDRWSKIVQILRMYYIA